MAVEDHIIHLENGRLGADTPVARVNEIVEKALDDGGEANIVVHFHGGLVNEAAGRKVAETLHTEYLDAGAYPIFFVWESGLFEVLRHNLRAIFQESIFKLIWKRVSALLSRKLTQSDAHRSAGVVPAADTTALEEAFDDAVTGDDPQPLLDMDLGPVDDLQELTAVEQLALEQELLGDLQLQQEFGRISNSLREPSDVEADQQTRRPTVQGSTTTLMDPAALDRVVDRPDPAARGIISTLKAAKSVVAIAARVIRRFAAGRHHGPHATIVEEILREFYVANAGGLIWAQMKQDTADAFQNDAAVFGGTAFLAALRDRIDPTAPPRITLVGHSTGAVFISEFIAHAAAVLPAQVQFGVVFEAPASTCAKTAETLTQHRARIAETLTDHGARRADFRMFTMSDAYELEDRLVPVIYPHSLLYFVSGVVEFEADAPLVGMARFYEANHFPPGDFPDVATVRDFVAASAGHAVWSVTAATAAAGHRSQARGHTEFDDDDEETLESVKHILRVGF